MPTSEQGANKAGRPPHRPRAGSLVRVDEPRRSPELACVGVAVHSSPLLDPPRSGGGVGSDKPKPTRQRRHTLAEPSRYLGQDGAPDTVLPNARYARLPVRKDKDREKEKEKEKEWALPEAPVVREKPLWPPRDTFFLKRRGSHPHANNGHGHASGRTTPVLLASLPPSPDADDGADLPAIDEEDARGFSIHSADLSVFDRGARAGEQIVVRAPLRRSGDSPPGLRLPAVLRPERPALTTTLDLGAVIVRDVVVACPPQPLLPVALHAPFWEAFQALRRSQGSSAALVDLHGQTVDVVDTVDLAKMLLSALHPATARPVDAAPPSVFQLLLRTDHEPPTGPLHVPLRSKLVAALRPWLAPAGPMDCVVGSPPLVAESLLSPLAVLHFFLLHRELLGALGDRELVDLGLVQGRVRTVPADATAMAAVRLLLAEGVSALPVVDDADRLLGSFSASDLRFISQSTTDCLTLTVERFTSALQLFGDGHGRRSQLEQAPPSHTLHQAITQLVNNKAHRLHVVDAAQRPVGVVTPKDILRLLLADLFPERPPRA